MDKQKQYWKTKSGQLINVDDMDIDHLRNVLKMILKNHSKRKLTQNFELKGEMANDFNDSNCGEDCAGCHICCGANETDLW